MAERDWILLHPGPANTTPTVRAALVMPDLCHREPEYFDMMRRCRAEVTRLAGCGRDWTTVLFTGSGPAAVEAPICSPLPPGGPAPLGDHGRYRPPPPNARAAPGHPRHPVVAENLHRAA